MRAKVSEIKCFELLRPNVFWEVMYSCSKYNFLVYVSFFRVFFTVICENKSAGHTKTAFRLYPFITIRGFKIVSLSPFSAYSQNSVFVLTARC